MCIICSKPCLKIQSSTLSLRDWKGPPSRLSCRTDTRHCLVTESFSSLKASSLPCIESTTAGTWTWFKTSWTQVLKFTRNSCSRASESPTRAEFVSMMCLLCSSSSRRKSRFSFTKNSFRGKMCPGTTNVSSTKAIISSSRRLLKIWSKSLKSSRSRSES